MKRSFLIFCIFPEIYRDPVSDSLKLQMGEQLSVNNLIFIPRFDKIKVVKNNDIRKNIKYWAESSGQDFQVAVELLKLRHYPQCLFFCHLSIEKFLKAITVKRIKNYAPYTHDLRKLAEIANLDLNSKQEQILDKISTFNIAGRYADAKFKFYQKYNKKEYALKYLKITQSLLSWLKKEFQKKQ